MARRLLNQKGVKMSLPSMHHSFDISLAAQYGIEEAILIHHFQHWIRINRCAERNIIEGRAWTYQKRESIAEQFPYLKLETIRTVCETLVKKKILMTANHNQSPFDKTLWYAFVNEEDFGVDEESSKKFYQNKNSQFPQGDSKKSYEREYSHIGKGIIPSLKDTISQADSLKGSKKAAASCCQRNAAAPSFEDQIKKSPIPTEEQEAAIKYFKDNPEKFKKAKNPLGLLITIVKSGDHKRNINDPVKNEELAKMIAKKNPKLISSRAIEIGYNYIFFKLGAGIDREIKFTAIRFMDECIECLTKMRIDVSWM